MALVKRHWKLALLNCILLLAGAAMLMHWLVRSHAVADETPPSTQPSSVDAVTYSHVQALRDRLALTNRDLAALGCSQQEASDVLSALLQWYSSNQASLDQLEQTQRSAQQQLAEAIRRVSAGPRDTNLLNQVKTSQEQALSAAKQRLALIDGAVATLQSHLSNGQQQTWQVARANAAAPARYRYLSELSAASSAALSSAAVKFGAGSSRAQSVEASVLGARVSEVNASNATIAQNIAAVIAAEAAVLPLPADLRASASSAVNQ